MFILYLLHCIYLSIYFENEQFQKQSFINTNFLHWVIRKWNTYFSVASISMPVLSNVFQHWYRKIFGYFTILCMKGLIRLETKKHNYSWQLPKSFDSFDCISRKNCQHWYSKLIFNKFVVSKISRKERFSL